MIEVKHARKLLPVLVGLGAGLLLVVPVGLGSGEAVGPHPDHEPPDRPTRGSTSASAAPAPATWRSSLQSLYNRRVTSKSIGHADLLCTFVDKRARSCRGTYFLPRGKLVVGGSLRFRQFYELAVLGGTGLYNNARGTLTVTRIATKPTRDIVLFRLVG